MATIDRPPNAISGTPDHAQAADGPGRNNDAIPVRANEIDRESLVAVSDRAVSQGAADFRPGRRRSAVHICPAPQGRNISPFQAPTFTPKDGTISILRSRRVFQRPHNNRLKLADSEQYSRSDLETRRKPATGSFQGLSA